MFKLFSKSKPKPEELQTVKAKLWPIAVGMNRCGKSIKEIELFLFQTVAVTTKWSTADQYDAVYEVLGALVKLVSTTDVIPMEPTQQKNEAFTPDYAAKNCEKNILKNGREVSIKFLTDDEYKAELEKRKAAAKITPPVAETPEITVQCDCNTVTPPA